MRQTDRGALPATKRRCPTPRENKLLLSRASVIIPVGPGEASWRALSADLGDAQFGGELIFSATGPPPDDWESHRADHGAAERAIWISGPAGRAHQMNEGARAAASEFVWFLHADSRVNPSAVAALDAVLNSDGTQFYYFDLAFLADGPRLTQLNARGANLRSRWLGLPFGDQGFCLRRSTFLQLGGYQTDASYGEDHLLVWESAEKWNSTRPR